MRLISADRHRLAVPGQADQCQTGWQAELAEALPPLGALGRGEGNGRVTLDDTVRLVHENESIYLPIGFTHRMANPGKIDLEFIEVQVCSYTGEDVRIEDIYGA